MAGLTCGNCGKGVAGTDVTCPHCGVLLAAYASPTGSVTQMPEYTAPEYAAPPPPSSQEPTEMPAAAASPQPETPEWARPPATNGDASTAPQPLFDTQLTAEALAEAADSDDSTELITIGGTSVLRDPAVPEVSADEPTPPIVPPPAADPAPKPEPTPPADPAPEPAPPLQQFDTDAPTAPTWTVPDYARQTSPEAGPVEEEASDSAKWESWRAEQGSEAVPPAPRAVRSDTFARAARERQAAQPKDGEPFFDMTKLEPFVDDEPESQVGETEAYLRKLHTQVGYKRDGEGPLTKPVPQRRPSVMERQRNRARNEEVRARSRTGQQQGRQPTYMLPLILGFFTFVIWMNVLGSVATGDFSVGLVFWAVIMVFLTRAMWMRASNWNKRG